MELIMHNVVSRGDLLEAEMPFFREKLISANQSTFIVMGARGLKADLRAGHIAAEILIGTRLKQRIKPLKWPSALDIPRPQSNAAQYSLVGNMADLEKVATAASRRSDRTPSVTSHTDNQSATSKEDETDSVVPSYTARDGDLESGHDDHLQPIQSSRSRRSARDSKLVWINLQSLLTWLACGEADFRRSLGKDPMTPKIQRIGR